MHHSQAYDAKDDNYPEVEDIRDAEGKAQEDAQYAHPKGTKRKQKKQHNVSELC